MESTNPQTCFTSTLGQTRLGLPITVHQFGKGPKEVLILGGVHGDEPEGVIAANGLLTAFLIEYK